MRPYRCSTAAAGRRFPFAMQLDGQQRLWVLVADSSMRGADLLLMDSQLRPERVLPLSPDQDPNAIAMVGQELLLPDMTQFTVHRVDLDGRVLEPFGDAPFRGELASARSSYEWGRRLPSFLLGSIGVLMALGLWLAWKAGELRQLGGKRWQALHRTVYAVAGLAVLHFFWMRAGKNNFGEVAIYAAILGALLGWRLWHRLRKRSAAPAGAAARRTAAGSPGS